MLSFVSTAKGQKGSEGLMGPKGLRGRPGQPGPAIFFDSSEEIITIKGEKVYRMSRANFWYRDPNIFA